MQIIIDIPDEQIEKSLAESKYIHENEGEKGSVHIVLLYTNKKLEFVDISRKTDFYSLTDKYTILPQGHGKLIDADAYKAEIDRVFPCKDKDDTNIRKATDMALLSVPTIIEADKEE